MTLSIAMPISSFLPNLGGAEVGLHNIARRLAESGHRPVVMAPAPHVARLRDEHWTLPYAVEAFPPKIWSILARAPWLGFWLLDRHFAKAQSRHRFDVWHCTMGYPTGVALVHFARTRQDIRYLIRCAGEDIQRDPEIGYGARLNPGVDRIVREWLPQAQMLTAISDSVADEYRTIGVPEKRIRYIPNGVDLGRFERKVDRRAVRARLGIDPDAFLFLSVGRNHPKKNYGALLEATAHLAAGNGMAFHVAIVGKDTSQLEGRMRELDVSDRVSLIEQIGGTGTAGSALEFPAPELVDLYRAAEAFVFPSLMETFGIAIVEAMAAGLPVIVGDSPGCRDVVRRGLDGIMVAPRDPQAIASAMSMLMSDADVRRGFVRKARERARDFSWDAVVTAYLDAYDTLRRDVSPRP